MRVEELIRELEQLDPDLTVVCDYYTGGTVEVTQVEVMNVDTESGRRLMAGGGIHVVRLG